MKADLDPVEISSAGTLEQLREIHDGVRELFFRVFGKPLTEAMWRHYYLDPPWGTAVSFFCRARGRIVAHGGLIPQRLIDRAGRDVPYYLQTAVMVDGEYRDLTVFKGLMDAIHGHIEKNRTFVIAFPNDRSYLPFVKLLEWKMITVYGIREYAVEAGEISLSAPGTAAVPEYAYRLTRDDRFLAWRGELNGMRSRSTGAARVFYKDYQGALEVLDVQGGQVDYRALARELGYTRVNIPDCFLPWGSTEGLRCMGTSGIEQRLCVWPARGFDYAGIQPSLLLSDVF